MRGSDSRYTSGSSYDGTLWQNNLDGSEAQAFVPGLGDVRGIAINQAGTIVYAIDGVGKKVQPINLSDKSVTDLVTGAQASGNDIADEGRGHIYWTTGGGIRRAEIWQIKLWNAREKCISPFFFSYRCRHATVKCLFQGKMRR